MKDYTLQQAENIIHDRITAMANSMGFGLNYMEPYVILSKIKRNKVSKNECHFLWQNIFLFKVIQEKSENSWQWHIIDSENNIIDKFNIITK